MQRWVGLLSAVHRIHKLKIVLMLCQSALHHTHCTFFIRDSYTLQECTNIVPLSPVHSAGHQGST